MTKGDDDLETGDPEDAGASEEVVGGLQAAKSGGNPCQGTADGRSCGTE